MFVIVPLILSIVLVVIFVIHEFTSIILTLKFTFSAVLCEYLSLPYCNTNCIIYSIKSAASGSPAVMVKTKF